MHQPHHTSETRGYILMYSLIMITLFASIAGSVVVSTVRDLEDASREQHALTARMAAESGYECISMWQSNNYPRPLDTNSLASSVTCHTGGYGNTCTVTTSAGTPATGALVGSDCVLTTAGGVPGTDCTSAAYLMRYGPIGSADGPCVSVEIKLDQLDPTVPAACGTSIISRGFSDCSGSAPVERAFWGRI